ncbi:MAG: alpha/beta fold hydrolase [Bacteroides sp.]|nr:alpha/beta fold hydrolase [Bacteroides sp.]
MKERCGIVFVHGIVGNNNIFNFLMPLIPADTEVTMVGLEGHSGDALGFSRASMNGWKRQVSEAVSQMASKCDRVIGVGHSMGCLLLLEKAFEGNVSALFLLNPPIKLKIRARLFVNSFKVAFGFYENDEVAQAAKEAYGITLDSNPLHYYGWPARYLELFAEIRRVRRLLAGGVSCSTCALLSQHDEMVAVSSAEVIASSAEAQVIILPQSHHYQYSETDRQTIARAFTSFFEF